jgi:glycosyltransferase involved in cell wall biosynthesis
MMRSDKDNTAIIIPAYNAEKYLTELVYQITKFFDLENIIVVNDASTDDTRRVCEALSVKFLEHSINQGKGAALLTGFEIALKNGFQYAISIDADLQHEPAEILEFLKKQQENDYDMVIGKREFKSGIMPFHRIS